MKKMGITAIEEGAQEKWRIPFSKSMCKRKELLANHGEFHRVPAAHSTRHIYDLVQPGALENAGCQARSVAAAADRVDALIARQLVRALRKFTGHDVRRRTDVTRVPLIVAADVENIGVLFDSTRKFFHRYLGHMILGKAGLNPGPDATLEVPTNIIQSDTYQRTNCLAVVGAFIANQKNQRTVGERPCGPGGKARSGSYVE